MQTGGEDSPIVVGAAINSDPTIVASPLQSKQQQQQQQSLHSLPSGGVPGAGMASTAMSGRLESVEDSAAISSCEKGWGLGGSSDHVSPNHLQCSQSQVVDGN